MLGDAAPASIKQGALYAVAAMAREGGRASEPFYMELLPAVLNRQADKVSKRSFLCVCVCHTSERGRRLCVLARVVCDRMTNGTTGCGRAICVVPVEGNVETLMRIMLNMELLVSV
jgi:hypothetical protein